MGEKRLIEYGERNPNRFLSSIYISKFQVRFLKKIQKEEGVSRSELIRRAIDFYKVLLDYPYFNGIREKITKDKLIFICHPYTPKNGYSMEDNLHLGALICKEVLDLGLTIISPIHHSHSIDQQQKQDPELWYEQALRLLKKCDVILMCPGWQNSKGCKLEYKKAIEWGIKIIEYKNGWRNEITR